MTPPLAGGVSLGRHIPVPSSIVTIPVDLTGSVDNTPLINTYLNTSPPSFRLYVPPASIRTDGIVQFTGTQALELSSSSLTNPATFYQTGSSAGLVNTGTKTSNYIAVVNDNVQCAPPLQGFTVFLPSSPADQSVVFVTITTPGGPITVKSNGTDTITGASFFGGLSAFGYVYCATLKNWQNFASQPHIQFAGNCANKTVSMINILGANPMAGADHPGGYAQLIANYAVDKGVRFYDATTCAFTNSTISNCGGDGICFSDDSLGSGMPVNSNIFNVTSTHNGGNAMSCDRSNGLVVDTYTARLCGQNGIDFEPNNPNDPNETVTNVEIKNSSIGAYRFPIAAHGGANHSVSFINFHDSEIHDTAYVGNPIFNQDVGGSTNVSYNWTLKNLTFNAAYSNNLSGYDGIFLHLINNVIVTGCDFTGAGSITGGVAAINLNACTGTMTITNNNFGTGFTKPLNSFNNTTCISQNNNIISGSVYNPQTFC